MRTNFTYAKRFSRFLNVTRYKTHFNAIIYLICVCTVPKNKKFNRNFISKVVTSEYSCYTLLYSTDIQVKCLFWFHLIPIQYVDLPKIRSI